jgi:dienelactone hydrolase
MKSFTHPLLILAVLLLGAAPAFPQASPTVKQAPDAGVVIPEADRQALTSATAELAKDIETFRSRNLGNAKAMDLLPDVQIFEKAVDWALRYDEFMNVKQVESAKRALTEGASRLLALKEGKTPWLESGGPVLRGFVSKIDGSVQPYGLFIPEDYRAGDTTPRPLLVWLAGRSTKRTELTFLDEHWKGKSEFTPPHTIVVFSYGRFCNATKFAGETDVFEDIASVKSRYAIDPQRIAVAGFSMGGASTWHLATHHAGMWCAMSPGAGFAETEIYADVFNPEKEMPPWWEQVLYRLYDATDYVANLSNNPLLAYSGEIDPQKKSADMMAAAAEKEGVKIERIIGPNTGHKYEPGARQQVAKWLDEQIAKGTPAMPPHVRFTTYTLRYNVMKWITVDALEKHWERADIDAELVDEGTFRIKTKNITAFTIALPPGPAPLDKTRAPRLEIDGQELVGPEVKEGWTAHFKKHAEKWAISETEGSAELAKEHNLSGPIDDAFMDSFIFVRPTGTALNEKVGEWSKSEMDRAIVEWRRVFRGDARVKDDTAITPEDAASANLVLWGDPGSNAAIAKILANLPIQWTKEKLTVGKLNVSAADHAPILIYPNPMNPKRYVVLNSSFTFRQGSTTSNALQTPKLPDWAVIDLRTPPSLKWPGQVVDAGFFDEAWRLPK